MLLALLVALLAAPVSPSGINWVEDDFPGAVAKAKKEHKLVFVDAWATWCHSCLSMQRFVFVDPGMKPVKDAVVWVAIETETEKNRVFTEKYAIEGLPTFLLIDPATGEVQGRWLGSGSVNDLRAFVHDGASAFAAGAKGKLPPGAAEAREGHAAQQKADHPGAAEHYRKAVAATGAKDAARPERVALLAGALAKLGTPEAAKECVALGKKELSAMGSSAVAADLSLTLLDCADKAGKDAAGAAEITVQATARLEAMVADPKSELSADDRSDILATLAGQAEEAKDAARATTLFKQRAKLLEDAAAAAPDFVLAATFDAHRTDTYIALHEPQKAYDLLVVREQQMPTDYNPTARLARVLLELKRPAEAEVKVDQALAKMTQGPRRLSVLTLKAKILTAQGKSTEAVLREQLVVLKGLPAAQQRPSQEKKVTAELAALEAAKGAEKGAAAGPAGPAAGK